MAADSKDMETRNQDRTSESASLNRQVTVLVVEDDRSSQVLVQRLLEKLGCAVLCVDDGEKALEAFQNAQKPLDLILMDCLLPRVSGYEATRRIRNLEAGTGRRIPIIAMTAHTQSENIEQCRLAGMDDFLAKPVRRDILQAVLSKHASGESRIDSAAGNDNARGETRHPILDTAAALSIAENDLEILRDVIQFFLEDAPVDLEQLHAALNAGALEDIRARAHALKGAATNLGGMRFRETAYAIEMAARAGELPETRELYPRLQSDFEALKTALERTEWDQIRNAD
ncbi:MAG: response regulator [Leptospiraceae bacterium]|nr:response regulator [Leptospiraceae bacterium]